MQLYGGIEAGGTKFVCMVGSDPQHVVAEERFATTTPAETIDRAIDFFYPYVENKSLVAVGIASFGPLDLNLDSPIYGYITTTPKPGWSGVDLYGEIERRLRTPVAIDTDVNAAAFGEQYWSPENRSLDPFLYITVGTGIGVGVVVNGVPLHGLMHPEAGHLALPHDWQRDPFPGVCPYHGDCLEGLASGSSMAKRWEKHPEDLPDTHPAWELETDYLAIAVVNLIYAYSPQRIIVGGGVSKHPGLHQDIQCKVKQLINGYIVLPLLTGRINLPLLTGRINEYILPPALGNRSGGLGAIAMAREFELNFNLK